MPVIHSVFWLDFNRLSEEAVVADIPYEVSCLDIHGKRRAFVKAGSGPALLLLHGLGADHTTWAPVIGPLAQRYTVIAPDFLGHGLSDKPRADYTLGGYANGMRDLMTVLGIRRATVVGHSFGGGVAMQFAYQYPERTDRIVLVAPGGLGPEVTPLIRAISSPGFGQLMALLTLPGVRHVNTTAMRLMASTGWSLTRDLDEVADIYESFRDPRSRAAIRHVVRAVVDWRGQVVTMSDRAYLTAAMPMCVVWGEDDRVIPASHARNAGILAPEARIELVPDAGHFPHKDNPQRFARIVDQFIRTTEPSKVTPAQWRRVLKAGPARPALQAEAGEAPVQPVRELAAGA